jgi:hypothetical protein
MPNRPALQATTVAVDRIVPILRATYLQIRVSSYELTLVRVATLADDIRSGGLIMPVHAVANSGTHW